MERSDHRGRRIGLHGDGVWRNGEESYLVEEKQIFGSCSLALCHDSSSDFQPASVPAHAFSPWMVAMMRR